MTSFFQTPQSLPSIDRLFVYATSGRRGVPSAEMKNRKAGRDLEVSIRLRPPRVRSWIGKPRELRAGSVTHAQKLILLPAHGRGNLNAKNRWAGALHLLPDSLPVSDAVDRIASFPDCDRRNYILRFGDLGSFNWKFYLDRTFSYSVQLFLHRKKVLNHLGLVRASTDLG